MILTPFAKMRELLSKYPARPSLELLGDKAHGILRWILEEYMHVVYIYRHVNDLDAHFRACSPYNRLCNKPNLACQDFAAIFWGYH